MKMSNATIWGAAILAGGSIALSGCGRSTANPTIISYHQVGICKQYDTPNGPQVSKSGEGFAVFKIESVDNTKPSSSFDFAPSRVYVDQSTTEQKATTAGKLYSENRRFVPTDTRFAQAMGIKSLARMTIPAGEKLEINTFVVVPLGIDNPSGGPEGSSYAFNLLYDASSHDAPQGSSEGIVLTKTNPPDTKYWVAENCKEISLK